MFSTAWNIFRLKERQMSAEGSDERWLKALSGRETGLDDLDHREAAVLRTAISSRVEQRGAQFVPSEAHLAKIEALAREQGLLKDRSPVSNQSDISEFLANRLRQLFPAPGGLAGSMLSSLVSSVAAGVAPNFALRGVGRDDVVLRVLDISKVAHEWQHAFLDARVDYATLTDDQGSVFLHFKVTPAALAVLCERNIQPPSSDWCTLLIESADKP